MNLAAMVDEIGRAVSASVSRSLAPISRQIEELTAWRKAVGELRNGIDGAKGDAGIAGKDGAPGINGKDGANGKDGEHGRDAAPVDMDAVVAKVLPLIAVPKDGKDGQDGSDGIAGKDGQDGKNGSDGLNGKDGANGIDGKDGIQGVRGEKGEPPSAEELAAAVTKACEDTLPGLISKHVDLLMDGIVTRASLLVPPGRDGMHGRPGTPGDPGRDGVSIETFAFEQIDKRTHNFILKMKDGSRYEWPIKLEGMVIDSDVHRPGESYEKGDAVTHGGSYWIAKADTNGTPGKSDDWRLAVKRGRDGKDAE